MSHLRGRLGRCGVVLSGSWVMMESHNRCGQGKGGTLSKIKALVITSTDDKQVALRQVEPTHDSFVGLVGDVNTDTVFFTDEAANAGMVKVGANGKANAAPANPRATQLVDRLVPGFAARDHVAGTAVFAGVSDDGDAADVSDEVVGLADGLFGVVESD